MSTKIKRLPDSELEIMKIIWEADKPVSRAYIDEQLIGKKDWAITTVLNLLARLIEKGFVSSKKEGKMNIYTAIVAQEDYLELEGKSFLERLYGNSVKNFVANLYNNNSIDDDSLDELRQFLDEAKKKET